MTESAPKRSYAWLIAPFGILLLLITVGAVSVLVANNDQVSDQDCVKLSSEQATEDVCITLEEVVNREDKARGLSGRDYLPIDKGMLFDFGDSGEHCMWMPDMHFSIDMIWLDQSGEVVDIAEDVHPDTYPETFCNETAPARYVIEVNAGVAETAAMSPGQQIQL